MLDGKTVAVVVPAYDEEKLLPETLAGIPVFVDRIYVVDDASRDGTAEKAAAEPRAQLIRHETNQGVGAAILTGYKQAIADRVDVTCVMAADNQMAPDDLEAIARPVVEGDADYAKANRLVTGEAWQLIPHARYLGNAMLSLLTKIASGYWHVADSQSGFTAISLATLEKLDLDRVYPRYGFPNDMLVHLNVVEASRPGRAVTAGLQRRRAVGHPLLARDPSHLVAPVQGVLVAAVAEVRDPGLPPARVLLRVRDRDVPRRAGARHRGGRAADPRQPDPAGDSRARGAAAALRLAVHAVRDVVRPGEKQRPALTTAVAHDPAVRSDRHSAGSTS